MNILGWSLLIACAGGCNLWAAAPKPAGRTQDQAAEKEADMTLVTHSAVQWLKVYPLPIYKERWNMELTVKSLGSDLPRVRSVFAKAGASLVDSDEVAAAGPLRKMSYRCSQKSARQALLDLRKIGSCREPVIRPIVEPVALSEVEGKISALEADRARHGVELSRMPAVSGLVEELLGHLRGVESALRKPEVEVLIHLTVGDRQ
ncbi:MAG TPA: hypothetical protein DEB40_13355 [Elusimicrobia bacterium]|nr:hypothetical protein [Elusimicrobiota bacterium]HBT62721.1 hypothetical protein [Elusimicrobiota bacterium]